VAAVYHAAFGWRAPYGYMSVPVVLGTVGGIGLVVGPAGLFYLRQRRDPALADPAQAGLDVSFIVLLIMSSLTGLLLLATRHGAAMGLVLLVHLGFVLTLFLTLPYGKFVHGLYRTAALVKWAMESGTGTEAATAGREVPFDEAQGRPFDAAQVRPFDVAHGKPVAPYDRSPAPVASTLSRPPRDAASSVR
jgi:hypothetical protein